MDIRDNLIHPVGNKKVSGRLELELIDEIHIEEEKGEGALCLPQLLAKLFGGEAVGEEFGSGTFAHQTVALWTVAHLESRQTENCKLLILFNISLVRLRALNNEVKGTIELTSFCI